MNNKIHLFGMVAGNFCNMPTRTRSIHIQYFVVVATRICVCRHLISAEGDAIHIDRLTDRVNASSESLMERLLFHFVLLNELTQLNGKEEALGLRIAHANRRSHSIALPSLVFFFSEYSHETHN